MRYLAWQLSVWRFPSSREWRQLRNWVRKFEREVSNTARLREDQRKLYFKVMFAMSVTSLFCVMGITSRHISLFILLMLTYISTSSGRNIFLQLFSLSLAVKFLWRRSFKHKQTGYLYLCRFVCGNWFNSLHHAYLCVWEYITVVTLITHLACNGQIYTI